AAMREKIPVLIFPEGTSELGPSLLPIKKGAAFMCHTLLAEAGEEETLSLVPLGLHYEEGWRFRSAAEIHIGPPV
ncbi:1-acyl-sn-glycerol-3-phosphate acyltransferase, partial [Acinetobacter baumannii]|uniref:1-acyl-sn-glycerol-3-phosphate acyltransferase n=1 Tax=Acinetobacter baumannii TaxID=470 RepID=UPI000B053320